MIPTSKARNQQQTYMKALATVLLPAKNRRHNWAGHLRQNTL